MALTKKEKAITILALKEKLYLLNKDLHSYYYDLNHDKTALKDSTIELLTMFNRKQHLDLRREYEHKINSIEKLKKQILDIEKIISKLEAENGIKSSR